MDDRNFNDGYLRIAVALKCENLRSISSPYYEIIIRLQQTKTDLLYSI